jgi:hypothetical protein
MSQEAICNSTAGNVVRLASSTPIITHEQLAATEFEADTYFVEFDKNPKAMEEHEAKLRSMGVMSRFAVSMLGKTKAELIEAVRSMDEKEDEEVNSGKFLWYMTGAREQMEALLAFITTMEIRWAIAAANVYADDGENLPPIPKPPVETLGKKKPRKHLASVEPRPL